MSTRKNFPSHKAARKAVADANLAARANRTDAEQLAKLESQGHGDCTEAHFLRIVIGWREAE